MKIYSFFSKYGCVDASTVHIKLTKKDYEQFASGGMAKQWNRALERWVHDKIQQWDWKNFHNTLAPKQNNEYSNSADSYIVFSNSKNSQMMILGISVQPSTKSLTKLQERKTAYIYGVQVQVGKLSY